MHSTERSNLLSEETIKRLSQINAKKTTMIIVSEWASICVIILLCNLFFHWYTYILTVVFVGARQHALGVLMHDGVHGRLYKNKKLNDSIAELCLASLLFFPMRTYREQHLTHHANVNTNQDPDWVYLTKHPKFAKEWFFPMSPAKLCFYLSKNLFGLNTVRMMKLLYKQNTKRSKHNTSWDFLDYTKLGLYLSGILLLTYFQGWQVFFMYWLVPMITWFSFSNRIRIIADHFANQNENEYNMSRTTYLNLFERIFIGLHNISYHLDHHLYPSVPFYNLKKLHGSLLEHQIYQDKAHITKSYWGVLKECVGQSLR